MFLLSPGVETYRTTAATPAAFSPDGAIGPAE
jgi:hypothetical protein